MSVAVPNQINWPGLKALRRRNRPPVMFFFALLHWLLIGIILLPPATEVFLWDDGNDGGIQDRPQRQKGIILINYLLQIQ